VPACVIFGPESNIPPPPPAFNLNTVAFTPASGLPAVSFTRTRRRMSAATDVLPVSV
jgi:hypothetical protein